MALTSSTLAAVRSATDKKGRALFAPLTPYSEIDIRLAESQLGVRFSESHRDFLKEVGAGQGAVVGWWILAPGECYAFDDETGRGKGCIAIAQDICGNYLAFDPSEEGLSGERAIYYFCHDPSGYARLAPSFDEFLADAALRQFKEEFVSDLPGNFVYEAPAKQKEQPNAKWWAFWRKS
jgi:hypothetical protein